ncbi:MAG: MBL fold metallo-hydrolase [Bacteroidetes bacterium]|jgi:phosphoribosyl 1,2-cyclic phosphodiesterase|nr:MBL fold metallo-hydrolase [Bacteroidota bacterium]
MTVTFWGVRGSIPVPGEQTLRYGGNTTCVSIEQDDQVLVIDAGTGIRDLGDALLGDDREIFMLLSHLHADHIAGFPFFAPLYENERVIHLMDYPMGTKTWSPLELMDGVFFPVEADGLSSRYFRVGSSPMEYLYRHGLDVTRLAANHPGGAFGYCVRDGDRSFVFFPDNELHPPEVPTTPHEAFVDFCRGVDVLCHDAQYLDGDLPNKHGWGHSCIEDVCDLAIAAEVGQLLLFHHDPERTDEDLDAVEAEAQERLDPHGIACACAYDGLTLELD